VSLCDPALERLNLETGRVSVDDAKEQGSVGSRLSAARQLVGFVDQQASAPDLRRGDIFVEFLNNRLGGFSGQQGSSFSLFPKLIAAKLAPASIKAANRPMKRVFNGNFDNISPNYLKDPKSLAAMPARLSIATHGLPPPSCRFPVPFVFDCAEWMQNTSA